MPAEIVMPKLGLTMTSGTITSWLKAPGEPVRAGEPLLEVATDKINYEVEAPASGIFTIAHGAPGDEFECGAVIGVISLGDEQPGAVKNGAPPPSANGSVATARIIASPAARRVARSLGVALASIIGTGPRGRITLRDLHNVEGAAATAATPVPLPREPDAVPPNRRAIFRKMEAVGRLPLAHVETQVRVDAIAAAIDARTDFGWTAFAIFAAARILRDHPIVRTDATSGTPFETIDIGFAADAPQGLIVPVVRGALALSLAQTERELRRLVDAARSGTLGAADIGGACFSISNVGPQRIERVVPLPDPPQTAILGLGAATLRPAVVDGAVVPARVMDCILTFDHRFVDGAPAARFLRDLALAFENPSLLL